VNSALPVAEMQAGVIGSTGHQAVRQALLCVLEAGLVVGVVVVFRCGGWGVFE